MQKLDYIPDPRYAEDGLPGREPRPNNATARRRQTMGARSGGGMLKRSLR